MSAGPCISSGHVRRRRRDSPRRHEARRAALGRDSYSPRNVEGRATSRGRPRRRAPPSPIRRARATSRGRRPWRQLDDDETRGMRRPTRRAAPAASWRAPRDAKVAQHPQAHTKLRARGRTVMWLSAEVLAVPRHSRQNSNVGARRLLLGTYCAERPFSKSSSTNTVRRGPCFA